ncbi:hypothetical protein [Amycolatopsis sp. 195334CR]|uniref:hypothetical protein n=1 Tax=Amycolatopsis sp. 195334CR TaxID=2814588 RepID=UPI001A8FD855|nr:hypothetical protein [Amycolatopsis sp. 195334CR]MBN6038265.1 hypothetical protein [Amycolatopsis sp. 195334CR]
MRVRSATPWRLLVTAVLCGLLTFAGLHADATDGAHSLGHDAPAAAATAPGPSCAHDPGPAEPEHGHPSAAQGRASIRDDNGPIVPVSTVPPVSVLFTAAEPGPAGTGRTGAERAGWPLLISLCVSRT